MEVDLRRLVVRHRHVAPMVSALLAGTDARVRIVDADGATIIDRQAANEAGEIGRHPITVERRVVGWVEGGRVARAIAGVLSYAAAREADKRSLAREALDRYRELTLIYDLAGRIGERLEIAAITAVALEEAQRIVAGANAFLLLADALESSPEDRAVLVAIAAGEAEIVNDVGADPRTASREAHHASLIAAPLVVRGTRLGVIGVATLEPHAFRAGDLRVLEALAALTAPALAQAGAASA